MFNRTVLSDFANNTVLWLQQEMSKVLSNSTSFDNFGHYKIDAFDALRIVGENPDVQTLFGGTLSSILTVNHLNVLNKLLGIGWSFHEDHYYNATTAFKILNHLTIDDGTETFVTYVLDFYCLDKNIIVGRGLNLFDVHREAKKEYVADEDNMVSVDQAVFGKQKISMHDIKRYRYHLRDYDQNAITHYLKPGFEELIFDEIWHTRHWSHTWTQVNYGIYMSRYDQDLEDMEIKFKAVLGRLTNDTVAYNTILTLIANQSDPRFYSVGNEDVQRHWIVAVDIANRGGNQPSNYSDLVAAYKDFSAREVAEYYRTHPQYQDSTSISDNIYMMLIFLMSLSVIALAARPAYHALRKVGYFAKTNTSDEGRPTAVAANSVRLAEGSDSKSETEHLLTRRSGSRGR